MGVIECLEQNPVVARAPKPSQTEPPIVLGARPRRLHSTPQVNVELSAQYANRAGVEPTEPTKPTELVNGQVRRFVSAGLDARPESPGAVPVPSVPSIPSIPSNKKAGSSPALRVAPTGIEPVSRP